MEAHSKDRGGREALLVHQSARSHIFLMTSPNSYQYARVETGMLPHRTLSPDFQVGSHTHTQTDGYHNGSKPQSLSGFEFYLDQSICNLSLFLCSVAREIRSGRKSHFLTPFTQICHIVSSFLLNTLVQKVIFNPILLVNFEMP